MSNDETRDKALSEYEATFEVWAHPNEADFEAGFDAGWAAALASVPVPTDHKELIATKLAEFCPAWSDAMCKSLAISIAAALAPTDKEDDK